MYETSLEANADIPGLDSEHEATFADWLAFEVDRPSRDPRLAFVALAGGEVVGFASVDVVGDTGYHGLTGVRRAFRRRGIAKALKLHQIAAAAEAGLARLITESEETNAPMRALNEALGYRPIPGSIVLRGPLFD
jgi:ribosomal protein S18 acetylase RimI-like enzyme